MDESLTAFLDAVFPVMLYPDDPEGRVSKFRTAIYAGSDPALRKQWRAHPDGRVMMLDSYERVTEAGIAPSDLLADFQDRMSHGNFAALIIIAMAEMKRLGIPPHVNPAIKLACKEEYYKQRTIRSAWAKFKGVSPLWAAWNLMLQETHSESMLPKTSAEISYFLKAARFFFDFACGLPGDVRFEQSVLAIKDCNLWGMYSRIHAVNSRLFSGPFLPEIDVELLSGFVGTTGRPKR